MNSHTETPAAGATGSAGQTAGLMDYGPSPIVADIERVTLLNDNYRTALWTGTHLQLTLMNIRPGEDIGLERHPDTDQFLCIEQGEGTVMMGNDPNTLNFRQDVRDNYAIVVPAGTWHNLVNTGAGPLKLYSLYAPPEHPHGTVEAARPASSEHGF